MGKESFAIEPNKAIAQEENGYLITPYCTRGIMQKLNESRKACSASCDVVITVGDERFFCHRAILMECIPYVDKMFRSCFKESSENVITLKNLDAKAFATILECVYIGELNFPLPEDTAGALNIMTVCDYLGLADALGKCLDSFRSYLNSETVFDICACIVETGCNTEDLSKMVYSYILENFPAIYRSERFHSMPYFILEAVLKDDSVNSNEKQILSAIDKWVSYDEPNRLKFVNQLIDAVRIPYLYNLAGIGDNRSTTNKTLLSRVRSLQARMCNNPTTKPEVGDEVNTVAPAPVDKRAYKSVYFFCHRKLENIIDVVRWNGNSLKSVPSMSEDNKLCNRLEVVKLGSNFYSYVVDAMDNTRFRFFNNTDQRWISLRNPTSGYCNILNMVSLNGLQCVFLNYGYFRSTLKCYIPAIDVWYNAPTYPNGFYINCRMAADDDNNVIYAVGVNDRKRPESIMLDARVGKWSKIAPLPRLISFSALAYTENKVFVGGCYEGFRICEDFVYNVRSNSWSSVPPCAVHVYSLLPFENHLWAIGKNCVATYSLRDRLWSFDEPAINAKLRDYIYAATVD